jgi:hypothetical protein
VRAIWAEERTGTITDIEHFEVIRGGDTGLTA